MIACSVYQVDKMYGGSPIFENISFEIHEKDRVGLVGRNGSGKSTLFRLLAAKESVDSGQIHWKKGFNIGYLEQIPEFSGNPTTKDVLRTAFSDLLQIEVEMNELEYEMGKEENAEKLQRLIDDYGNFQDLFKLKGGYEIEANIEKIVNGLNIQGLLDKLFSELSGGEKTKVCLALILLKQPDFLLLDEPTNHLDLTAVEWLGNFLKGYDGTVVVVSHDRYFLDEVVNKILDLENGEVKCYHTNFSGFVKEKEEFLLREFHAYEEQQKKIKKIKEAIKRLREWANRANPPNEGLHKRARNMERALEKIEKLNRPILNPKRMSLEMDSSGRSGNDAIVLTGVSKYFGKNPVFEDVHIHIIYREKVAIVGDNGTGKTTLIKLILNQLCADVGEVRIGSNVKVGYLSQHIFHDSNDETIIEEFRNEVNVTEGEARRILSRFLFYGHKVFQKVSQLSGGEKMRLRLAQLMYQDVNLLILDEPTNHLDIESREVLEEVLDDYSGTILAVSHDRYFLNKLFKKIYWIDSKKVHCFQGNYQWAKEKMDCLRSEAKYVKAETKEELTFSKEMKQSRTNKYEYFEEELERLGQKISELDKRLMAKQELEHLQKLYEEKEMLEMQWEELYNQICELDANVQ
ncbi:ribosomal protection-like ABC-F family protein [Priestia megaterium]|uniref:ribosomal protection-like ABC-F family protein n=1 Tax=Priestia megaterium TaxID=1404 RepID=UPI0018A0BCE0|nr:ABC-F type ribosomal protection protein [Priestia megaterium]